MRIITKVLVAVSLLTGGIAAADTSRDHRTESTQVAQRGDFDRDRAPAPRFERHGQRRGYEWVAGQWTKLHHRWVWQPGHFERIHRGR